MKKTIIAFAVLGILLLASIGAYDSSISDKQAQAWEQALKGAINHALRPELSAEDRLKLREFMELLPDEKSAQSEEMTA